MSNIFILFLLLHTYIQDNIICSAESTNNRCVLQSITLNENFQFDFTQFDNKIEIVGNKVIIDCVFPCQKVIIQGDKDKSIHLILEKSTIKAEFLILQFNGDMLLRNTFLSSDNKSQQYLQTLNNCVSKTGYCVIKNDVVLYQAVSPDLTLEAFKNFVKDEKVDNLSQFEGYGKQDKRPGAGQIIINVNQLRMFESKITASYSGEDYKSDVIVPGTAGYIFIKVDEINLDYETVDNKSTFITKGACLIENSEFTQTSSSSGFMYVYTLKIMENNIKDSKQKELNIEDLQEYFVNSICYTSSNGYLYVANDKQDFLIANYQQQKQRVLSYKDDKEYVSKFKYEQYVSVSKIIISNLKVRITILSDQIQKMNDLLLNNANFTIESVHSQYITLDQIISNFSEIQVLEKLLVVKKDVELFNSFLLADKILFENSNINLEASMINTILSDTEEIKEKPETQKLVINLKLILDNYGDFSKYNFIAIDAQNSVVKLINTSTINSSMIAVVSKELRVDKTSKLNAQFQVQARELTSYNKNCGFQGQNNGGLGFLNFTISNAFCLKNWIVLNNQRLQKFQTFDYTVSSQPSFIRKEQFISRTPIIKYGGFICLTGEALYLEGQINANGIDSVSDNKFYLGSSAGGVIEIDYQYYYIYQKDDDKDNTAHISVKGGKGELYMGPSGGGKVFFNYQQQHNSYFEEQDTKSQLKLDHFDLGYNSFSPENVGSIFPNTIFAFFSQNKNIFLGQAFNRHVCEPGFYGVFCKLCGLHTFKPTFGFGRCFQCPCEADDSYTDIKTNIQDCRCIQPSVFKQYFLEIFIITGIVFTILLYQIQSFKKLQQAVDDKILFTIEDISNTEHIVELQGFNVPKNPTVTNENKYTFLKNGHEFAQQTNRNFQFTCLEVAAIDFLYFFNLVPLFKFCQNYIQSNKIRNYQKLLSRMYFPNKQNVNYDVKLYYSANKKYMMILFVNSDKKIQNYQYNIQFPYQITILGKGTFQNQFKIDFGNPFNILLIKTIKRRIKQEHYQEIKKHIPHQLLWRGYEKAHPVDIYFSYLTVLLASLQLRIPSYQIRRRVKKLHFFWNKMNSYFKDYGYQFLIFVKIKVNNKSYFYEFFKLIGQSTVMQEKVRLLFLENQDLYPNLIIECHKIQRKRELSIFFPDLKEIEKYKFQEDKSHDHKIQITEDKIKVLQKIQKREEVYTFSCCPNVQRKMARFFRKFFWRFQTFYNCNQKRMPYYIVKIILFVVIICFRVYLSKKLKFKEFLILVIFYPSFVEEINLILICLQIFLNKQRLNKFIIQLSFLSFFKSIFLYSFVLILEWKQLKQKDDLHYFVPFVILNSLMYLMVSYLNCYHFSFSLFDITYEKIVLIK